MKKQTRLFPALVAAFLFLASGLLPATAQMRTQTVTGAAVPVAPLGRFPTISGLSAPDGSVPAFPASVVPTTVVPAPSALTGVARQSDAVRSAEVPAANTSAARTPTAPVQESVADRALDTLLNSPADAVSFDGAARSASLVDPDPSLSRARAYDLGLSRGLRVVAVALVATSGALGNGSSSPSLWYQHVRVRQDMIRAVARSLLELARASKNEFLTRQLKTSSEELLGVVNQSSQFGDVGYWTQARYAQDVVFDRVSRKLERLFSGHISATDPDSFRNYQTGVIAGLMAAAPALGARTAGNGDVYLWSHHFKLRRAVGNDIADSLDQLAEEQGSPEFARKLRELSEELRSAPQGLSGGNVFYWSQLVSQQDEVFSRVAEKINRLRFLLD